MPRPHRHTCGQRLFALCPLTCVPAQSLSLLQTLRGNLLFSVALLRPPLTDFQWVPVTYSGRAQLLGFPLQVLPLSALTALSYPVFLHGLTHARAPASRKHLLSARHFAITTYCPRCLLSLTLSKGFGDLGLQLARGGHSHSWARGGGGGAADFLLVRPRLYFLFQLGPFSQPEGPALPPECFQGFVEVVCAARYFLWC